MARAIRKLRGNERGAAALEFALVAPALILFIIGVAQLGILYMANSGLRHAVGEGARHATIFPRPSDDDIRAVISDSRFGLHPDRMTIDPLVHGVSSGAEYAEIRVTYTVPLEFIFFELPPVTLTETRRAYLQPVVT